MQTLLIVEDEIPILNALTDKFAREGFSVFGAKNGEEGLNLALKTHPDLILLDIIMPVMNGITMLKKLREDDWGKGAKIILLTNLSDEGKVAEGRKYNATKYLIKSDWKIKDVVKTVKEELAK